MQFKDKFVGIWSTVKKYFLMQFCLSVFTVLISLPVFGLKFSLLSDSFVLYTGLVFGVLSFFFWFRGLEEDNKKRKLILKFCSPLFLMSLLILTISNLNFLTAKFDLHLIQAINPILIFVTIFSGFIIFYSKRETLDSKILQAHNSESETIQKRDIDFSEKFIQIDRIPILKNITRWCYKHGWFFSLSSILIFVIFFAIKIAMPLIYNASYLDEYTHIYSGITFLETGHFAEIYHNEYYIRGAYASLFVALFFKLFGQTLFVAKMIPSFIGLVNFYLLFNLAKRTINEKRVTILLMLAYTISPWIILNHFYLRMYVFYEFFILFITFCLFKLSEALSNNQKLISVYYIVFLTAFDGTIYYLSNDTGIKIILFFELVALMYIYIFSMDSLKFKKIIPFIILKSYVFKAVFVVIFTSIGLIIAFHYGIVDYYFNAHAKYTTPADLKFDNFFFKINPLFSVLFILTFLYSLITSNKLMSFLPISAFVLFALHLFSSKDIQTTRAILYFLPIFYLLSLSKLGFFFSGKFIYVIYLLILLTVVNNYPVNFLKNPYIPQEVNYISNDAYDAVKNLCSNKLLITSARPNISMSWNIHPSYYLNTQYSVESWKNDEEYPLAFLGADNLYYDSATKIPLIIDLKTLKEIVSEHPRICYLEGGLPPSWVNPQTRDFLYSNFNLYKTYTSNGYSFEMRLYIKS